MSPRDQMFLDLEAAVLDPAITIEARADLISDDFTEHGSSGRVYDKAEVLHHLPGLAAARHEFHDFRTVELADEVILAIFRFTRTQPGRPPVRSLRSSIWRLESGRWRLFFHQGTLEAGRG